MRGDRHDASGPAELGGRTSDVPARGERDGRTTGGDECRRVQEAAGHEQVVPGRVGLASKLEPDRVRADPPRTVPTVGREPDVAGRDPLVELDEPAGDDGPLEQLVDRKLDGEVCRVHHADAP